MANNKYIVQKIPLSRALPPVLGVGAYLKNALCLIQAGEAWISRDNGSLDSVEAITRFQETAQGMIECATIKPVAVAHDWHPDFYSTRWALQQSCTIGIQHHHAHVAAVMAEHGIEGPVLGLALDGFGLGQEQQAWGGELLRVDREGFVRIGHLKELPQPGGDSAARQPWRMGAAALWTLGRGAEIASRYADQFGAAMLADMMDRKINSPMTSSAGRLFDAACGLLGVLPVAQFEGEAPMKLESMVTDPVVDLAGWKIVEDGDFLPTGGGGQKNLSLQSNGLVFLGEGDNLSTPNSPSPVKSKRLKTQTQDFTSSPSRGEETNGECDFKMLPTHGGKRLILDTSTLLDALAGMEAQAGANLFHGTLAAALLDWVERAAQHTDVRQVALCGGCFFNKVLRERLVGGMIDKGITPLLPKQLSVGDPAIALGQAYAAALGMA